MIDGVDVEGTVGELLSGVPEYVWNGEKLPVPVDEISRGDVLVLRSSAVEVHASRVGSRGEALPVEAP